jgi:hypothetical protein
MSAIPSCHIDKLQDFIKSKLDEITIQNTINNGDFYLNIIHFVIGSYVYEYDFKKTDNTSQRNHECPAIIQNLVNNPIAQCSPSMIEMLVLGHFKTLNINQIIILIDPQYKHDTKLTGLTSVYPSFDTNPILAVSGYLTTLNGEGGEGGEGEEPIMPYNSILEPIIIQSDIAELQVKALIGSIISSTKDIQQFANSNRNAILINSMDCSSRVMRHAWIYNDHPRIYQTMPDCMIIDSEPEHMPVITFSSQGAESIRWCNWRLDKELIPVYQLTSPTTYRFLITNYQRYIMDILMLGFTKLASRMNVSRVYTLSNGVEFTFNTISQTEFRNYWQDTTPIGYRFREYFMAYLDGFFAHNVRRFIEIILALPLHPDNSNKSITQIGLDYIKYHITEFNTLSMGKIPMIKFNRDIPILQLCIGEYLNAHNIYL